MRVHIHKDIVVLRWGNVEKNDTRPCITHRYNGTVMADFVNLRHSGRA